jgi:uncharacterized delta-60 repeat protein
MQKNRSIREIPVLCLLIFFFLGGCLRFETGPLDPNGLLSQLLFFNRLTQIGSANQNIISGEIDASFGNQGLVFLDPGSQGSFGFAVQVSSAGKIFVAGKVGNSNAGIFRLNSDGSLDSGFGSGGVLQFATGVSPSLHSLAIEPDGSLLSTGANGNSLIVVKARSAGALDSGFGNAGIFTAAVASIGYRLIPLGSGRSLVCGTGEFGFFAGVITGTGAFDTSFGTNGYRSLDVANTSGSAEGQTCALSSTGRIVVGGFDFSLNQGFYMFLNEDSTFSDNVSYGMTTGSLESFATGFGSNISGMIPMGQNHFLSTGFSAGSLLLEKISWFGTPDSTFGNGGIIRYDLGSTNDSFSEMSFQPDGKLVVTGTSGSKIAVIRIR